MFEQIKFTHIIFYTSIKSKYILCFLFLLSWGISFSQGDSHSFSKVPPIQNFNTYDYNGGIQNWAMEQNSKGFIYVANNFGLLEFDGEKWRKYTIPGGTRTQSLFIDNQDRIFVGGQNEIGYFVQENNGYLSYVNLLDKIPGNVSLENVWKILEYDGKIYFNTRNAIFLYEEDEIKIFSFKFDIGFIFSASNRLFFHADDNGIFEWNGEYFTPWRNATALNDKVIVEILPSANGSLLIFTKENSVYKYQEEKLSIWNPEIYEVLKGGQINDAVLLRNNDLAIGTQNMGVLILDPLGNPKLHISEAKGLNSNTILSMHEDHFKNLWLGLNNGIAYMELGLPFSFIDRSVGISGTGYAAALHDDRIYLGTNTGLYTQPSSPNIISNNKGDYHLIEGTEGQVYNIHNIQGNVLMGHHLGAFEITGNKAKKLGNREGTWKFERIPGNSDILAGTYSGFESIDATSFKISPIDNFKETSRLFEFENDSTLWMTHGYKGAFRIILDTEKNSVRSVSFYGEEKGFPSNILINVFRLGSDLVFTAENGIYKYNKELDIFEHDPGLENHLGNQVHVSKLNMDPLGNIYYIIGSDSMGVLSKSITEYENKTNDFKRINKYISDDLQNINILDHENILIGSKQGFIHYNPTYPERVPQDFQSYIRSVLVNLNDSIEYLNSGNLKFGSELYSIKFEFSSPYFDGYEDIEYQYLLENFEENWSDWSPEASKEYTNLSTGTYTFKIRSKNIYDEVSSEASLQFVIYPPWYASSIAIGVYSGLVLLLFGYSLYRLDSKHKDDKKELEMSSQRKLQQREEELKNFSEKSQKEIIELRNEKLRSEVDHKTRELTSSTMHLLNKNEFMLGIKNNLDELSKKSDNKVALRKIIKTIDRNIEDDKDWDQFSQYFDQVHGDFLKRLKEIYPDITPQETKLAAYLRMNLSSKNIAQLSNISVRGVEIGRYRLRKKLNLTREVNLTSFLMDF